MIQKRSQTCRPGRRKGSPELGAVLTEEGIIYALLVAIVVVSGGILFKLNSGGESTGAIVTKGDAAVESLSNMSPVDPAECTGEKAEWCM